jgi:hypothetical protein
LSRQPCQNAGRNSSEHTGTHIPPPQKMIHHKTTATKALHPTKDNHWKYHHDTMTGYPSSWTNYFFPFKRQRETSIATALVFRGNERQQDIITRLLRQDVDTTKISTVIFHNINFDDDVLLTVSAEAIE